MRRKELAWVGRALLLLVIALILQTMLVSRISVLGVTADLFVILTVIIGLNRGSLEGAIFGFFAGIAHDTIFFQPLGVDALILVLVGYFVGMFPARFGSVNLWVVFIVTGIASFAGQLVFGLFQYMMGPRGAFFTMVGTQMIPEAVFDALIAVPIYILLLRVRVLSPPRVEHPAAGSSAE